MDARGLATKEILGENSSIALLPFGNPDARSRRSPSRFDYSTKKPLAVERASLRNYLYFLNITIISHFVIFFNKSEKIRAFDYIFETAIVLNHIFYSGVHIDAVYFAFHKKTPQIIFTTWRKWFFIF